MAMAPLGGGGDDLVPLADINITPFVDVVLVLLIVFMVAAPLMTASVPVDLPRLAAAQPQPEDPLVLSLDQKGEVWLKEERVEPAALPARLARLHDEAPERVVYLRGDRGILYGRLMEVMEELRKAGFAKISLATEPKEA